MPSSEKIPSENEARVRLQTALSNATPYYLGITRFNEAEWLLIRVKTKENAPVVPEEELSTHRWSGLAIHDKRWLFLHVKIGKRVKKSFAFNCNDPNTLSFLRHLLRDRRLMIGFADGLGQRLDPSPATTLVEDLGDILGIYIPDWKNHYKQN